MAGRPGSFPGSFFFAPRPRTRTAGAPGTHRQAQRGDPRKRSAGGDSRRRSEARGGPPATRAAPPSTPAHEEGRDQHHAETTPSEGQRPGSQTGPDGTTEARPQLCRQKADGPNPLAQIQEGQRADGPSLW